MKIIIISGYFNPVHSGHMDYIKSAKKLGDYLIVIVNNDKQVKLKDSVPFMKENERIKIIKAIEYVDEVVLSIDEDNTVCKTLEMIKSFYKTVFANGGDRRNEEIPEKKICDKLGIKIVDGVGGEKIQSSSSLIKKSKEKKDV